MKADLATQHNHVEEGFKMRYCKIFLASFCVALLFNTASFADTENMPNHGTFYFKLPLDQWGLVGSFNGLLTLRKDGTLGFSRVVDEGGHFAPSWGPDWERFDLMGPCHGVWEKTGNRSLKAVILWFAFDADTKDAIWLGRITLYGVFAPGDHDTITGELYEERFPCTDPPGPYGFGCPDPTLIPPGPSMGPMFYSASRVRVNMDQ
jgi:hypothetical protein